MSYGLRRLEILDPYRVRGSVERKVQALMRWRLQHALKGMSFRRRAAVQLIPVMLQASFAKAELDAEAPGVEGLSFHPRWSQWARRLSLPLPGAALPGPRKVRGVYLRVQGKKLECFILLHPGLGLHEEKQVALRAQRIERLLAHAQVPISVHCLDAPSSDQEGHALLELGAFGALLAGQPPAGLSKGSLASPVKDAFRPMLQSEDVAKLAELAPTPFSTVALLLFAQGSGLLPADVLAEGMHQAHPMALLSRPDFFCALWAELTSWQMRFFAWSALRAAAPAASWEARGAQRELSGQEQATQVSAQEVMEVGRELSTSCLRSVRMLPRHQRAAFHETLRNEILPWALPRALHAGFARALRQESPLVTLVGRDAGGSFEVLDHRGTLLSRARHPEQAWVRALALLHASLGNFASLKGELPRWPHLEQCLRTEARGREFSFVMVEPPQGSNLAALALLRKPRTRPSARVLQEEAAVRTLLLSSLSDQHVEIAAAHPDTETSAARLRRTSNAIRLAQHRQLPLAVEVGSCVLMLQGRKVLRFGKDRFLSRPRRFFSDPDSRGLNGAGGGDPSAVAQGPAGAVYCSADLLDAQRAVVVYTGPDGSRLREEVAVAHLEQHLQDARRLLGQAKQPLQLCVRASPELVLSQRSVETQPAHLSLLEFEGDLKKGTRLVLQGETFGATESLGWAAAAQVLLSTWPLESPSTLSVSAMRVTLHGVKVSGLPLLYARSFLLRRLWVHIQRTEQPLKSAGTA